MHIKNIGWKMTLTSNQLRAARALLNLTQESLAERSGIALESIKKFEKGYTKKLQERSEDALIRAFHDRVEFLDNEGVKFKPVGVEIFEGPDRFEDFYTFMYEHLEHFGGEVCLSTLNEKLFREHRTPEKFEQHRIRMRALVENRKVLFRVLTTESYHFNTSSYAQYRWQEKQGASPTAFYAFGNCLALISFDHDPAPYVVLHKSGPFAEAYRTAFDIAWRNGRRPQKEKTE
jgi:transcriptional regulator with XRE-family HTH domain